MNQVNLVVIARNEARCIQRCLESARPFVDAMIVLDTGSIDATPQLARACGARVSSFEWVDDFSVARNAALALSDAAWNLILDADEWCAEPDVWARWRTGLASDPFLGEFRVRNTIQLGGREETADSWVARLLPASVRFEGRIHEQPASRLARQRLNPVIGHDGYLPELAKAKHGRNLRLLGWARQEEPQSAYLAYQYAAQCEVAQDWEQACQAYDQAVALGGDEQPFAHSLRCRQLYALKQARRLEEAIELGMQLRLRWPTSSDVFFTFGDLCLELATQDPAHALSTWLPAAETAWLQCLNIGESTQATDHVQGRGSHLAAHNLSVIYEGLGMETQAQTYRAMSQQRQKMTRMSALD